MNGISERNGSTSKLVPKKSVKIFLRFSCATFESGFVDVWIRFERGKPMPLTAGERLGAVERSSTRKVIV